MSAIHIITLTGIATLDTTFMHGPMLDMIINREARKGHHVIDSEGMYLVAPQPTSELWRNPTG